MKSKIAASILSADLSNIQAVIQECESAGVDWIHVDVMDGHFVPNLTMGAVIVNACHKVTQLPLDCHLMVEKPESLVEAFVMAGASSITIHPENNPNVHRTLQMIRQLGCRSGLAINPGTSPVLIEPLLENIDLLLVMTVNPGFSGQSFLPQTLKKVEQVEKMILGSGLQIDLEVDGGINASNIRSLQDAGANVFVSASAIFQHPQGIAGGVSVLRKALK
ncbi:MAG: ribulose-phosphate 3-epimerase [Anaerolineaceae bacterium]